VCTVPGTCRVLDSLQRRHALLFCRRVPYADVGYLAKDRCAKSTVPFTRSDVPGSYYGDRVIQ
jgi:hypothetical protein